jgi:hypothetical protein
MVTRQMWNEANGTLVASGVRGAGQGEHRSTFRGPVTHQRLWPVSTGGVAKRCVSSGPGELARSL